MESEETELPKSEDQAPPVYSFVRVALVMLFGYVAGLAGAGLLFLVMFAPCGIPISIIQSLFGEMAGLLVIFSVAGGFVSGCFINLYLPRARWRLILLLCGNPTFLLFVPAVVLAQMGQEWSINGITLRPERLDLIILFLALGTLSAVLGDWYTWRRAERVGVR